MKLIIYVVFISTIHSGSSQSPAVTNLHGLSKIHELLNHTHHVNVPSKTIRIAAVPLPPYVMKNNEQLYGLEIDLIEMISQYLHLNVVYVDHSFKRWGLKQGGVYNECLGLVSDRKADMVVGMWYPIQDEQGDDFLRIDYFIEDFFGWIAPTAGLLPTWKNLLWVFDTKIWSFFGVTFVTLLFIWHKIHEYIFHDRFSTSSIFFVMTFLGQLGKDRSNSTIYRLFLVMTVLYSGLMLTSYQSNLYNVLTAAYHEKQIATVQDIADSKITLGVFSVLLKYIEDQPILRYNKMEICPPGVFICTEKTAKKRDQVSILGRKVTRYLFMDKYRDAFGNSLLFPIPEPIVHYYVQMGVRRDFAFYREIRDLNGRLYQAGLIQKVEGKYRAREDTLFRSEFHNYKALGVQHFQGSLALYLVGLTASLFMFFNELG